MTAVRTGSSPLLDRVPPTTTDRAGTRHPAPTAEEDPMDHDPRCCAARLDPAQPTDGHASEAPIGSPEGDDATPPDAGAIDWIGTQIDLDRCDGYVVLAADPQTGEVDAHGPFPGVAALTTADGTRARLDREGLEDIVVRVVRWHRDRADDAGGDRAA